MSKQKLTIRQLKEMIREAVREQLKKEQISGLPSMGGVRRGGYVGGQGGQQQTGGNQWISGGFNLDQLVAAMKQETDPNQKKQIQAAIAAQLKAAGWGK